MNVERNDATRGGIELVDEVVHPQVSVACEAHGGVQCGFCTTGFAVMSAWLADGGTETGSEPIPKLLEGNICRCGSYQQLNQAIDEIR